MKDYDIKPDILTRDASELSNTELFERIAYKIRRKYDEEMSEAEACEAARNLIGFHETLVEIAGQRSRLTESKEVTHEQENHPA